MKRYPDPSRSPLRRHIRPILISVAALLALVLPACRSRTQPPPPTTQATTRPAATQPFEYSQLHMGVRTRLLIYAAQMIAKGISPVDAAEVAICSPITDDRDLQRSIREIVTTII